MTDTPATDRRIVVLGSTGSIGVNTLEVVNHLNGNSHPARIVGLGAGRSTDTLIAQTRRFHVPAVSIADVAFSDTLTTALPGVEVFAGGNASVDLVEQSDATDLVAAVVGSAGLPATIAAIKKGMNIALANKETLVAAGELVTPLVEKHNVSLLPVDSEHSAIFQCIAGQAHKRIKRIVLTASGGPFRQTAKADMDNATVEQALNHPTWNMGPKITIDSATMMNKALEIIEAHWLFGLGSDKIDVIIHPQSIAHSFVEFEDNSILAQLGPPDMKTPIQYALTYPDRATGCSDALDWTTLQTLAFEQPDHDRFPSLQLAYRVIDAGGTSGAVFNAANEAAVDAFLNGRIRFGQIVELVERAMDAIAPTPIDNLETVLDADRAARAYVGQTLQQTS